MLYTKKLLTVYLNPCCDVRPLSRNHADWWFVTPSGEVVNGMESFPRGLPLLQGFPGAGFKASMVCFPSEGDEGGEGLCARA